MLAVTAPAIAAEKIRTLPEKLHQDARNAVRHPAPSRWRALIKRYRRCKRCAPTQ